MAAKKKIKIRILNPLPGEAAFTSEERAKKHVATGIAVMKEGGLLFIHSLRSYRRERRAMEDYWASLRKCVSWSGPEKSELLFRPGEIRS